MSAPSARADLTWGAGGTGGSGSWDATSLDWWNGSTNVAWDGSSAIFQGTAGTVTVANTLNISANTITFNVPGYVLQNGWINNKNTATSLTIVANDNATIGSTIGNGVTNGTLIMSGSATLTLSGNVNYDTLQINSGEVRIEKALTLGATSGVNFANTAGALLSLDVGNATVGGLSGGGSTGGVVQAAYSGSATTLQIAGSGSFAGVLQDNGVAKLSVTMDGFSSTQTLTGANTYSGTTTVTTGTLVFGGGGSALNTTAVTINNNGALTLDNTGTAIGNRLGSVPVTVNGGTFQLAGNAGTAVSESLGNLKFGGAATVNVTNAGQTAQLSFTGITRNGAGTLNLSGNGSVTWAGVTNANGNLIAPYITVGNEWATASGGTITALSTYANGFAGGSNTDDVKVTGSGTTTLSGATTRNSLNLQNSGGSTGILDLGGNNLTLTSGGLLTSGANASQIQDGTLKGGSELVVTNGNALTISANISSSTITLTKSGAGTLTLTGANSYIGNTNIDAGTLVVGSDAALGTGSVISFGGGSLQASANFSSSKGFQTQTSLAGNINTNGFNLTFSGTNTGSVNKVGSGTLTETATATGTNTVSAGVLALPNATTGNATLQGGELLAAGTLGTLSLVQNSTLDIGGSGAASLTTSTFTPETSATLTVEFGLGSGASDLWTIGNPISGPAMSFVFDIQNLGGLTTGKNYELMSTGAPSGLTSSEFSLSSADAAAGIAGTFTVTSNEVEVSFTSVPEPVSGALILGLSLACGSFARFRRKG